MALSFPEKPVCRKRRCDWSPLVWYEHTIYIRSFPFPRVMNDLPKGRSIPPYFFVLQKLLSFCRDMPWGRGVLVQVIFLEPSGRPRPLFLVISSCCSKCGTPLLSGSCCSGLSFWRWLVAALAPAPSAGGKTTAKRSAAPRRASRTFPVWNKPISQILRHGHIK